jgi:hypothetical protein
VVTYDTLVAGKCKHHPAVARQAEEPAVPHANHDEREHGKRAALAGNIHKDLQDRLSIGVGDRLLEVLDGEEESHQHQEPEQRAESDTADDSDGGRPTGIPRLL